MHMPLCFSVLFHGETLIHHMYTQICVTQVPGALGTHEGRQPIHSHAYTATQHMYLRNGTRRFQERWEPKKGGASEEVQRVVQDELDKLGGLEPVGETYCLLCCIAFC